MSEPTASTEQSAVRLLLPVFLIVLVDVMALTLLIPLLPFYAQSFGASPLQIGLLLGSYSLCQLFAGPVLGSLSDRVGRKPLLIVSQIGTFISFLMLASATTLTQVFAARMLDGATAGNLSLAQAYIADVTKPQNRAKSFALIGIAFGVGFLIGPAISGRLSKIDHRYPIYVAAALSLTSILCTTFLLPKVAPKADPTGALSGRRASVFSMQGYADYFRRPVVGPLLWQFFCFSFAFAVFMGGFALFAQQRLTYDGRPFGTAEVGYVLAYSGAWGIVIQGGLVGRLVARFGEPKVVLGGFLASVVGYALLSMTSTIWLLAIAAAVNSWGSGVLRPAITSRITQTVERHEQGVALGLTQSLQSISQVVGPVVAGVLIHGGFSTWWALAACASCAAGAWLQRSARPLTATVTS